MEFVVLGWPEDEPRLRLDYRQFSYAGKFVTGRAGVAVVRESGEESHLDRDGPLGGSVEASADSLPALPDGLDESDFDADILTAVAFTEDRTDPETLWIRYLTVRRDLRGGGRQLGPRLAAFMTDRAADRGYGRVRIAVNNVFSYEALYKAEFAYTGEETGLAELVLERPVASPARVEGDTEKAGNTETAGSTETATADATVTQYQHGLSLFGERSDLSAAEREFLAAKLESDPPALLSAVRTDSAGSTEEND